MTLDPALLAPGAKLAETVLTVRTKPLVAAWKDAEFYQDPKDAGVKQVTATLEFSHPVALPEVNRRLAAEAVGGSDVFGGAAAELTCPRARGTLSLVHRQER